MRQYLYKRGKIVSFTLLAIVLFSCDGRRPPSELVYQGDLHVVEGIDGIYSERGNKVLKVKSPYQATLQNQDRKYPQGLYIEFFEKGEKLATTLKSDSAYYKKSADKWFVERNVIVTNVNTNEVLTTQELIWDRVAGKILVDSTKTVKITTPDKLITGRGLIANENFTEWEMHNVTGIFYPEDETN